MKGWRHIYMLLEHSTCNCVLRSSLIGLLHLTPLVRNVVKFSLGLQYFFMTQLLREPEFMIILYMACVDCLARHLSTNALWMVHIAFELSANWELNIWSARHGQKILGNGKRDSANQAHRHPIPKFHRIGGK